MHLYKWENPFHSSIFLAGIWIVFLFVKPYMVITGMVIGFASCWVLTMDWFKNRLRHRASVNSNTESDDVRCTCVSVFVCVCLCDFTNNAFVFEQIVKMDTCSKRIRASVFLLFTWMNLIVEFTDQWSVSKNDLSNDSICYILPSDL